MHLHANSLLSQALTLNPKLIHNLACRVGVALGVAIITSVAMARVLLPPLMRAVHKYASQELYQLTIIAFCLVCAWVTGYWVRRPGLRDNNLGYLDLLTTMIFLVKAKWGYAPASTGPDAFQIYLQELNVQS